MLYIEKKHAIYTFSPGHAPVCRAASGDTVTFETYDCFKGQLLPENTTFADIDRKLANPATGPLYVEGAGKGDVLKVEILDIRLDPVGVLDIGPDSAAFKGMFSGTVINRLPVEDGRLLYKGMEIPVRPMVGVIGVAPESGEVSTLTPMDHGGNMDCTKIEAGSSLYLPVNTDGALLAMGDLHAIMGDGEVGNCGVEIGGSVTVRVTVLPGLGLAYPMIENKSQWITVAYGDTLDTAGEKSVRQMHGFLTNFAGLDPVDAAVLIDMLGNMAVCQIVNPEKTVRLEFPRWILEQGGFYGLAPAGTGL